jgi:hypothetical protein
MIINFKRRLSHVQLKWTWKLSHFVNDTMKKKSFLLLMGEFARDHVVDDHFKGGAWIQNMVSRLKVKLIGIHDSLFSDEYYL